MLGQGGLRQIATDRLVARTKQCEGSQQAADVVRAEGPWHDALSVAGALPWVSNMAFSGLGMGLGNLARVSAAKTRSISPETFSAAPGQGGMARQGTGARAAKDLRSGWH